MGTLLTVIVLLIALVALGFAWKNQQELGTVRRRLDRYNKALFDANDRILALEESLAAAKAEFRVQQMHRNGSPTVAADMTVREVTLLHPQAAAVLAGFHLGGCSSCAVDDDATLARICADAGVDLTTLLTNLNTEVAQGNGQGAPVKLPNVAVEF